MKLLVVGDVHAKVSELDDCLALQKLVLETASEYGVETVVYLGDQYDTHGVVHVEVQAFWLEAFAGLGLANLKVIALRGNHDMLNNGLAGAVDAMQVHDDIIVARSIVRLGDLAFAGFGADITGKAFLSGVKYLFCHHTFDGAKYENGFFAKDGLDPNTVEAKFVVSGHIHTPATIYTNTNKISYIGAPRWMTASDANIERAIYVIDTETDKWTPVSTGDVCSRILRYEDREEASLVLGSLDYRPKDRVIVDVYGPSQYVEERTKLLKAMGVRVRTFPVAQAKRTVSESEGVGKSWLKYCNMYEPRFKTPKADLLSRAQEELHVG